MALNASGPISLGGSTTGQSVNLELGQSTTATISFNDANVRTLTGTSSGSTLSMPGGFWGKGAEISLTISSNQTNLNLRNWALFNGWDGSSKAVITVAPGVYIYSTTTGTPGMTIDGSWPGGVTVINNGYIMGMGGTGGGCTYNTSVPYDATNTAYLAVASLNPIAGSAAISLGLNVTITNNSYIAGGGGGGGRAGNFQAGIGNNGMGGGGGGAGGGVGGASATLENNWWAIIGGTGGAPGQAGADGKINDWLNHNVGISGGGAGGGGRVIPGSGGAGALWDLTFGGVLTPGGGGGAGGGGSLGYTLSQTVSGQGGAGGSGNSAGSAGTGTGSSYNGGGGGGWGASGGNQTPGDSQGGVGGAAGGKAIALNGYTCTLSGSGTAWGGVS